jgi:hypothetical protein
LLGDELGAAEPFTLQYHMGDDFEFYCANVGRGHFLTLFFDMASRRGRIGTIWVFTQRAIKDLRALLPSLETAPNPADVRKVEAQIVGEMDTPVATAVPLPPQPDPAASPEKENSESSPADYLDIAPDELMDLLSGDGGPVDETADLDAFWDTALTDDELDSSTGISLDEALQRGLVDFDKDSKQGE